MRDSDDRIRKRDTDAGSVAVTDFGLPHRITGLQNQGTQKERDKAPDHLLVPTKIETQGKDHVRLVLIGDVGILVSLEDADVGLTA